MEDRYGKDAERARKRKEELEFFFRARCHSAPERWFTSPGRAEILGNHTDHNCGKALVAALSRDILCAVRRRKDDLVEICSEKFYPIRFSLRDLSRRERERGKSAALARGVAAYLSEKGKLCGFSACTSGNIPRGAGISSSAAFEVLVAEIFNALCFGGKLAPSEKAKAGQFAENSYFGKPCGLLDQSAVALGGLHAIDFLRPNAPSYERIPRPRGYTVVLTNTGGSHSSLTAHYAEVRKEMEQIARHFNKRCLREVSFGALCDALPSLRQKAGDRAVLRALHFFEENERVDAGVRALKEGDTDKFLSCIEESGRSSLCWLQNCAIPGSTVQPVVLALKLAERYRGAGAFRMMGGGFAGTVLAFLKEGEEGGYAAEMARVFGAENVFFASLREQGACEWKN